MAIIKKVKSKETFMGKLSHGADLLEELTEVCKKENIKLGRVEALGAVQKGRVGYYDQKTHQYSFLNLDQPMEITNLVGNISLKDGSPFVHAHITFSDKDGKACGGHLAQGTIVFAGEFVLEAFDGPSLERGPDAVTGLALWKI
ncbi:MAG: DNA-binding protein [Dehalococcoidia bacterium]|nr:DNA-binding protein [Dehalococcoidia bacterium]